MTTQSIAPDEKITLAAQDFINANKEFQRACRGMERTIRSADNPTQVAQEMLRKIKELLESDSTDSITTGEIAQRALEAIEPTRKNEVDTRASARRFEVRQSTTIEIDPKTGKPVILHGFNPRKTFG